MCIEALFVCVCLGKLCHLHLKCSLKKTFDTSPPTEHCQYDLASLEKRFSFLISLVPDFHFSFSQETASRMKQYMALDLCPPEPEDAENNHSLYQVKLENHNNVRIKSEYSGYLMSSY